MRIARLGQSRWTIAVTARNLSLQQKRDGEGDGDEWREFGVVKGDELGGLRERQLGALHLALSHLLRRLGTRAARMCGRCTEHPLPFNQSSRRLYSGKSGPGNTQRRCDTRPFAHLTEPFIAANPRRRSFRTNNRNLSRSRHLTLVDLNLKRMTITTPGGQTFLLSDTVSRRIRDGSFGGGGVQKRSK